MAVSSLVPILYWTGAMGCGRAWSKVLYHDDQYTNRGEDGRIVCMIHCIVLYIAYERQET